MADTEIPTCPFCGFSDSNDYQMLLHVEIYHSENGDSPFAVKDAIAFSQVDHPVDVPHRTRSSSPDASIATADYTACPRKCGERIPTADLQVHIDFHTAEDMALEDSGVLPAVESSTVTHNNEQAIKDISRSFSTNIPSSIRNHGQLNTNSSSNSEKRRATTLKELFFGSTVRKRATPQTPTSNSGKAKRLGTAELGPYANEKRMPIWLQRMLEEGAKVTVFNRIGSNGTLARTEVVENETPDLVPVLARLSAADRNVARAFFCSPEVRHVAKLPKEGGFCGYRNIQMLISYIRDTRAPGYKHFQARLPSIIKLQDMIEDAWDMGYNNSGRIETGGIRLTRKYIGTPEAQALFLSLGIPCETVACSISAEADAYTTLMTAVFNYFEDESTRHDSHRIFVTTKPPIYFQHHGHSMTIVGVEVQVNGTANLVVFDPMFNPSPSIKRLVGATSFRCSDPAKLLRVHRRGEAYLFRYKAFELLKIPPPTYLPPPDDTS